LKEYSEEILGEYQCGFRPQRGTMDQIFVVRQILENFYVHVIDLYLLFIDFKNAFDSINQKKLLESLVSFGIPRKIERLVKMTKTCENDTRRSPSKSNSRWENKCSFCHR
jgi:sorting nexin-29